MVLRAYRWRSLQSVTVIDGLLLNHRLLSKQLSSDNILKTFLSLQMNPSPNIVTVLKSQRCDIQVAKAGDKVSKLNEYCEKSIHQTAPSSLFVPFNIKKGALFVTNCQTPQAQSSE